MASVSPVARHVLLLNGPNLNLLGAREPEVYGSASLDDILDRIEARFAGRAEFRRVQSNHEGELVDALHDARSWADGVVFNPGAFTHTSIALRDAIASIDVPVVETHLSNIHAREEFRRTSVVGAVCVGMVAGFGPDSYLVAFEALLRHLEH